MMHTNKMMLVPYDMSTGRQDQRGIVNALDDEMQKIANDASLAPDAKLVLYNQTLHQYRQHRHALEKPFEIEIREPKHTIDENSQLLTLIPKRWRKNANLLLTHVKNNPSITWSEMGELIVDGNKVVGSNITDLVNDTCRESKSREPAIGSDLFIKTLLRHNTPLELIVNKKRLVNRDNPIILGTPITRKRTKRIVWRSL